MFSTPIPTHYLVGTIHAINCTVGMCLCVTDREMGERIAMIAAKCREVLEEVLKCKYLMKW